MRISKNRDNDLYDNRQCKYPMRTKYTEHEDEESRAVRQLLIFQPRPVILGPPRTRSDETIASSAPGTDDSSTPDRREGPSLGDFGKPQSLDIAQRVRGF